MIRWEVHGPLAHLVLDRPAARNALATEDWLLLAELASSPPDGATAVLLRSAHPTVFSAGANLADLARLVEDVPARAVFRDALRAGIEAVATLPTPLIVAVDGGCFGAGVALALAGDVIVAGEGARFGVPPARLGIGYPAPDVARLAARVGGGQAARLLFGAETIDGAEALRIGLADVPGDGATFAREVAANDAGSLRSLKAALRDPSDPRHDISFAESFGGARFAAAIARWRAKA